MESENCSSRPPRPQCLLLWLTAAVQAQAGEDPPHHRKTSKAAVSPSLSAGERRDLDCAILHTKQGWLFPAICYI